MQRAATLPGSLRVWRAWARRLECRCAVMAYCSARGAPAVRGARLRELQPSLETPAPSDYVRWERRSVLRRRGERVLRRTAIFTMNWTDMAVGRNLVSEDDFGASRPASALCSSERRVPSRDRLGRRGDVGDQRPSTHGFATLTPQISVPTTTARLIARTL